MTMPQDDIGIRVETAEQLIVEQFPEWRNEVVEQIKANASRVSR